MTSKETSLSPAPSRRRPADSGPAGFQQEEGRPEAISGSRLPLGAGGEVQRGAGWRPLLLCLVAGALLILCFPKANLGWLAFLALAPFLRTFPHRRARAAIGCGFLAGFVFYAGVLYWIAVFTHHVIGWLGIAAWLGLAGVQAAYVALFSLCANLLWNRTSELGRLFLIPSLWTLCEWLRQLGSLGMGWGDLAYTQWQFLPVLQLAPLAGCWAISWLVVFINMAAAFPARKTAAAALAVASLTLLWGFFALSLPAPPPQFAAAAIQADIDQDIPWQNGRPADPAFFENTLGVFGQMIGQARARDRARLCVIAETALPGYPRFDPILRADMLSWAMSNHTALAAGAHDIAPASGKDTNSLFVVTPMGRLVGEYSKQQLVPFGEYVPYRDRLPFLAALHVAVFDDQPGAPNQPAIWAGPGIGKIGTAICYESTYPRFLRQQTVSGANVLDVVTDDTWFGRTAAARQHMQMSAMRAAENHRYLVRCAATGISAIFGPNGRLIAQGPLFKRAVVSAPIAPISGLTLYDRWGDWFILVCALLIVLVPLPFLPARQTSGHSDPAGAPAQD